MPTDNTYLPLDDVLNFDVAEQPATKVAETEAKILKLKKEFEFDPQLSIASEMELERHREVEEIRRKAAQNQKTTEFLNSSDDRARVAVDDIDGLNSVADGLKNINGVPQLSVGAMESNIVDINANKFGGVFKSMAQQVNQNNDLRRVQQDNSALGQIKKFDSTKKPESTIEPIQDRGNKYWNAVKRGSASIIQLGSLLYDGGYEAFERGADMVTGWDVNGHVPYKTNKVFNAMQSLKQGEYAQSSQLNNLMVGSELAAKDAEANGENPLVASLSYLAKNGELGDAGEVVAEFVPSLVIGGGLGGMAERGAASLAERYVANRIGQSVAKNSIINPTRLAAVQVAVPKAVQGAVIAGSSDFVGSFAPEVEAQISAGYKESDAVARALTKSLAQAGVSAVGGSLLPVRIGGDLSTVATQSVAQGLFGYGSAAAGAASIGEDLSATEGALNILLGAVTALPEVVMVGSTSIRKSDIQQGINDAIVERAIASTYQKQEEQETRAVYSGAVIRDLIDRVKKTKTQERAPEIIRDFIKTMQDDPDATKEVYIDSEKFNQLASEYNIDVDSLFELSPELAREYERSNDVDGMIRIPLDELLTTFSTISNEDYLNAFADSIRVNPEALTAGEAKAEFAKTPEDFQGDVQQIKAEFDAEMKKVEDANSIANVIAEDLKNVAGFSADYNNNAKALVTAFYESLAAKTGVSARELYEAMPLRVVATDEQAQAIMRGDVDAFNQLYPDYLNDDLRELSDFYKSDDDFQFENGEKIDEIQNRIIDKLVNDDDFNGMFIKTNEGFASLSKSSKVEGQWQATYFDSEYNPISDGGVYDKKTAITDFIESINPIEIESKTNVADQPEQTKQEFQDSLKEKYSIDLGLTESKYNNQLVIEKIIVPDDQRGSGVGTNAMNEIVAYADNNGKVLTLTPSSDFGGNKKRLIDFYKRFGFVENKGKNKDFEISEAMYRDASEKFNQTKELLAPNGKPSNLNEKQWNQVRTDDFKKWFGDWENDPASASKVLDDNGEPLIVYHGTNLNSENGVEFTEFNTYGSKYGLMGIGSYFTENKNIADSYTKKERGSSPKIYEVYLSIKNPLDMDEKTDGMNWKSAFEGVEYYHEGGDTNESWFRAAELMLRDEMIPSYEGSEIMQDGIRSMGYDGITHIGGGRYGDSNIKHKVFIAFDPEQIKATTNKGGFNPEDPNIYNQSADPQVELRKIYGYRDSHLAPDAESGVSGSQIAEVYPELNNRDFTKNYGDGFKYDAKTVKIIREMQKNPDADVTIYRTVPKDIDVDSINFGDWVALTKDYADEHGKARFDGQYKIIEQVVKASDLYTDGNSIHEWGYSPKDSDIYKAGLELSEQLKKLNDRLDQGIFNSTVSKKTVLGDKAELKNNPAIAKMFLDSKGIEPKIITNKSEVSDSVASLLPELNALEYNSDITKNPDLLDRAFNALYLDKHKNVLSDPEASDLQKRQSERKISRFSDADADTKYNLISNEVAKVKGSKSDGSVNESLTRSGAIEQAKLFNSEYDDFIDNVLKQLGLDYYNQQFGNDVRGQIQFRKDKSGAVIILGKNADFSTFVHELGHHFLEMSMSFAGRPDAPEQLKTDMIKVMDWSKQGKNIEDWKQLTPEQKTEVHEKFAETFEQYLFTGKAPSNELRKVFAKFRTFMAAVYRNIEKFLGIQTRAELNPEIRDVMDRMLATQDAIEQVQRQRNLEFIIAQEDAMRMGISPKEYLELVEAHNEATEQAVNELEQKTISDLARYRNIRAKNMKAFSEQQKRVRQQVREEAAKEVAQLPVYQAIAFLRQPVERPEKVKRDPNVVDPKVDTLLEAIAKMGGIDAKEIESTWGTDKPESYKVNVGRVKKVARKDGLSIETVAERLAEDGYLSVDDHGKFDTRELEDLFSDSLIGGKYYSRQADPDLFAMGDDYGPAMYGIEEFPDNGKLNLEWLKAKYGEDSEIFKAVGKTGQYGLAMKEGLDPELVASNFGYESADAMIQDMANAPPPKDVIEERTNELIKAQYSDLFDEKEVELAIDEAVHNEIRGMMLARELTAITKLEGRWSELNAQAKEVARDKINRSLITEIRPHVFSTAELKHSKNYSKAIKSGDTMGAVRAKRLQLINFHATKQAYEANRYVDKLFDLVKKINGNDERLAKNRDFNLVALARWVAGQYGLIESDASYSEHIKNLKQYDPLAAMQIADLVYVQEDGVPELALPLKNYQEMTFEEFQTLDNIIRQIWHRSKESQKIEVGEKKVEFSQVVDALVTQTQKKPLKARNESFFGYVPKDSKSFNPQRALQSLTRAEQLFTWLDDGKANGFYHQYVFNPMQDSLAAYRNEQRVMMQGIVDIYSKFDPKPGKIDASMLGGKKTTFESKHELLHAILHTGNESNKKRLVLGYEWGEVLPDGSVDYTNWNTFIEKMFDDGVITKNDMDAIQEIWNLFDKYKGQAQEVHKKINGLYFKELPKTPINTPFGVYEGGYIPADYDRLQSVEAEQRGKANDASTQKDQFFVAGATTGANFTKSRVENYKGDVMVLDLTQLPMHLDRELRYIHLEQNLRQASKIFRNRDVMKSVEGAAPFSMDAVISDWLNAVANQRVSKASDYPSWDRFLERLRQNSGIVLMSGNIKNAVEALTSLPMVMTAVPKRELASSAAKYFTDAFSRESMVKHVRELSPFMDTHLDQVANEMRYKMERIVANPGNIKKTSDFLRQNAYVVQQVIQAPLEAISWNAAFNDALNRGMSKEDAIYHADGVVRMYLSDMSPEGMSKIERSNSMMRIMLMFYGWFNMVHNTWAMKNKLVSEDASLSGLQKMGKYASIYTMMIAMPAMLSKALTLAFNGDLFDNEDSEDVADDLVNIVVKSQAEMLFGMMPFARDIINPIYRTTFDATIYSDRYNISPVQSMVENMVKTGKRVGDLAVEGETDASALTKGMLQSATFATGVPFTIVQRPATYAADVLIDEDQEPENIPDAIRGTLNGR